MKLFLLQTLIPRSKTRSKASLIGLMFSLMRLREHLSLLFIPSAAFIPRRNSFTELITKQSCIAFFKLSLRRMMFAFESYSMFLSYFRVMNLSMLPVCYTHLKVFNTVVSSIMINVVNRFSGEQFTSKVYFHYMTMFKNVFTIYSYSPIAISVNSRFSYHA